jgi:nuclear pore complex protein Nup133
MPLTGEAMYWESVKKVAITDQLRQRQHSIHGTVNGLHSGESITSINEAEPDGFVLTTSNGRIAHLTTRDSQGRPLISTQILKGANSSTGSFFGSITSVFSAAGWQREIAAVRAGPLHGKSQRSCVVATAQGSFQIWGLTRHSSKTLYFEINGKDEMFAAIQTTIGNVSEASKNDFKVLDFAMFPTSTKSGTTADAHRLLVLTVIKKGRSSLYNLVELRMKTGILEVDVVHPITCFSELQHEEPQWKVFKARVLLPDLAQTAVIVLDTSIVFISLARIEESPSSQLQMESNSLPETFQDVVYLRKAPGYHVVGCSIDEAEPKSSRGRCILLIHGFGIAEIALSAPNDDTAVSDKSAMTVTSKVEQAIFFGGLQDNLLDFNPERILFGTNSREIEAAVLNINKSIMRSTSEYIPAIMPSVDHQLKLRADALAEIIRYTARWELQPLTRWELLWSGEKLAAAKAVWQSFNTHLRTFRQGERLLLPELLDMMHQSLKVENQPEHGESDIVRHYLIHDVWRIENVVYWAQQAITELHKEGKIPDPVKQANFVSQADDIQIHALEAAFAFRAANFQRYGFNADLITDGVYQGSYEGLPQFWTSIPEIVEHVKMLTDLSRETAINNASSPTAEEGIDISLLTKLVQDNPRLVHICCRVYDEHCRWLQYQSDPNLKANGDGMRREFLKVRRELILKLVDLELPDNGIELAEKYGDMQALVDVMEKSAMLANERIGDAETSDSEKEDLTTKLNVWGDRMESYFDTYGSKWAHATYSKMISEGKCAGLFDEEVMRHRDFLTQYLRGKPELAKLSWINEVLAEENYAVSADNLIASQKVETNIWNKKVELSMGKLAHLAAQEKGQTEKGKTTDFLKKTDRRMAILDIQDQLYDYVEPALRDAVDEFAKLGLAMEQFCKFEEVSDAKKKKKKPTLFKLFQQNLKILISRQALDPEELIDTLTLIYKDPGVVDEEVMEDQFFLALKFLKLSGIQKQDFRRYDLLEKIIWRRCLIRDDWEAFNRTDMKTEEDMKFAKASTAFFQTLKACYEYSIFSPM